MEILKSHVVFVMAMVMLWCMLGSGDVHTSYALHPSGVDGATGSPGETSCSRSGCHGAGTGGIADNAGPGSIAITSVPAFSAGHYIPATLYHMQVTISEAGRRKFGFAFEALDNSGNTDLHVNDDVGDIIITDSLDTRIWQDFFTGRYGIVQTTSGVFSLNSITYYFDWHSPDTGTVNLYAAGNATNFNNEEDSGDHIYTNHLMLTAETASIPVMAEDVMQLNVFPDPATNIIHVSVISYDSQNAELCLYSVDGIKVRTCIYYAFGKTNGDFNVADLPRGRYFLCVSGNSFRKTVAIDLR